MPPVVFVNYRTGDGDWAATYLDETLSAAFGSHKIFRASKSIPGASDFEHDILTALRRCSVVLAVIGPNWFQDRLHDPEDWVHKEIAEAYRLGIPVLPVLMDKTPRLVGANVPGPIAAIAKAQSLRLDHRQADHDMARLTSELRRLAPDLEVPDDPLPPVATWPSEDRPWAGGEEIAVNGARYLLQDGVREQMASDRSWVWRQAAAYRLGAQPAHVLLRGVRVLRATEPARQRMAAMARERELLDQLRGVPGMPKINVTERASHGYVIVLRRPDNLSLREMYGPSDRPLDYFLAAQFLAAMRNLCWLLGLLHELGHSHRALEPDAVLASGRSLRDIGNATVTPVPGEGIAPYQAPEQLRGGGAGPAVDVYQVAAITYHVLTGHPPFASMSPPVSATEPRLPRSLDQLLAEALDPDPARRPEDGFDLAEMLDDMSDEIA